MKKLFVAATALTMLVLLAASGCGTETTSTTANADLQKQIDDIKATVPKFAIPMREVGDRFDNMYFAAQGGNWALAAYMSKYMNNAMNPAKLTKPDEYPLWSSFYTGPFDPVNKAINAKDFAAFDTAYTAAITACNNCHNGLGYTFIKIQKPSEPPDVHADYSLATDPNIVPP